MREIYALASLGRRNPLLELPVEILRFVRQIIRRLQYEHFYSCLDVRGRYFGINLLDGSTVPKRTICPYNINFEPNPRFYGPGF